jgi:hypothetical protein
MTDGIGCDTIRRASGTDAARLAALSGVLGYPVAIEELAGRLERLLARADQVVLVAESTDSEVAAPIRIRSTSAWGTNEPRPSTPIASGSRRPARTDCAPAARPAGRESGLGYL